MRSKWSIVALPGLVLGTLVAGGTAAAAYPVDPENTFRDTTVVAASPETAVQTVDHNGPEPGQIAAGAVGGAAVVLLGVGLRRRRTART